MSLVGVDCFSDTELRGFIKSQNNFGMCDFSGAVDVEVIELDELLDFFSSFLDNVESCSNGQPLYKLISDNWNLFSSDESAKWILDKVLIKLNSGIKSSENSVAFIPEILENVGYWNVLKDDIKWKNRYNIDINELIEKGWDAFLGSKVMIKPSDVFYRARLHSFGQKAAYEINEMYAPLKEMARAGRANPIGIPYLYLSDNANTILYEIRAAYLDEVSVGKFSLKCNHSDGIFIYDFTEKVNLFSNYESINSTIKATLLRSLISSDLSRPMRRYDSEIDYIPTQFICEFIMNFANVQGIKFISSLHSDGNNFVIFDQDLMECSDVEVKKITKVLISAE